METENVVLITIFLMLIVFTTLAGFIVYTFCGLEPEVDNRQSRTWSSLVSVLVLAMIKLDQNERRMSKVEEELCV